MLQLHVNLESIRHAMPEYNTMFHYMSFKKISMEIYSTQTRVISLYEHLQLRAMSTGRFMTTPILSPIGMTLWMNMFDLESALQSTLQLVDYTPIVDQTCTFQCAIPVADVSKIGSAWS